MRKISLFVYLIFLLVSCSYRIDGSSEENYKQSLENLRKSLSTKEVADLDEALRKIAFQDVQSLTDLTDAEKFLEDVRTKLDGMSYDEIIEEGDRVQKIIDERNKEQARLEIEELYSKMKSSKKDSIELAKFKVEKSRFYKRKSGNFYITYDPIIDLVVYNGTDRAISRAFFKGILKSQERTIPWLVEDFNYEISGGIEPGEQANWKLAPNSFSEWGKVDAPKDAIFTVLVTKLNDADGEKLFSIDFDEQDKERLEELLNDYPEFNE
jgi:hypothetical protein